LRLTFSLVVLEIASGERFFGNRAVILAVLGIAEER
jgi:hypothetical protein